MTVDDPTPVEDWTMLANCRGVGPDVFVFPEMHGARGEQKVLHAKAICADCPVTSECLEAALQRSEVGIWGGLTEDERRNLKRRRRRAARVAAVVQPVDRRAVARDSAWLANELAAIA